MQLTKVSTPELTGRVWGERELGEGVKVINKFVSTRDSGRVTGRVGVRG